MKPTQTLQRFLQWLDTYVLKQLLVYVMVGILTLISTHKMDGRNYHFDAFENAVAGYYLMQSGTISLDGIHPTNFREPLPAWVIAMHLRFFTDIPATPLSGRQLTFWQDGERASQMNDLRYPAEFLQSKAQRIELSRMHIPFIALGLLLTYLVTLQLTTRKWMALLALLLSWVYFYHSAYLLYRPMTEYISACLMLMLAWLLLQLHKHPSLWLSCMSGMTVGALALTKASVFYVSLLALPAVGWVLIRQGVVSRHRALMLIIAMAAGMLLLVAPWMVRNQLAFGKASISDRGGQVLLARAFKNGMTTQEYQGAYFVYAPYELKTSSAFRELFGFNQPGRNLGQELARLYRARPGDAAAAERGDVAGAVSYLYKAVAYTRKQTMLDPVHADQRVQQYARSLILADWPAHLKTIPLYAWRGIWSFGHPDPVEPKSGGLLSMALDLISFACLLLLPVYAWCSKRHDVLLVCLFPVGLFAFYTCFSHFIPRYSAPMIPFAIMALMVMFSALLKQRAAK